MNALLGGISAIVRTTVLIQKEVTGAIKLCHVSGQNTLIQYLAPVLTLIFATNEDGGSENQSIPVEDLPPLSDRPCSSIDGTQTIPRETEQLISTLNSKSGTTKT